jgi:hypothetical protein
MQQTILVAFKDYKTRKNWYRNEAEIRVQLLKRIHKMRFPFLYFDPSVMLSYQVPSKPAENTFCQHSNKGECDGEISNMPSDATPIPASHFEIRQSTVSEMAGRGLFAAQDLPIHSVIELELQMNNFFVLPSTWEVVESMYSLRHEMNKFDKNLYQGLMYFIEGENVQYMIQGISFCLTYNLYFQLLRLWIR